jgi:hypothetical protein
VAVRVIAWLLAVVMMTGAVIQADAAPMTASSEVASASDDGLVQDPSILPVPVAVARPPRWEPVRLAAAPSISHGRAHGVRVFRPPR